MTPSDAGPGVPVGGKSKRRHCAAWTVVALILVGACAVVAYATRDDKRGPQITGPPRGELTPIEDPKSELIPRDQATVTAPAVHGRALTYEHHIVTQQDDPEGDAAGQTTRAANRVTITAGNEDPGGFTTSYLDLVNPPSVTAAASMATTASTGSSGHSSAAETANGQPEELLEFEVEEPSLRSADAQRGTLAPTLKIVSDGDGVLVSGPADTDLAYVCSQLHTFAQYVNAHKASLSHAQTDADELKAAAVDAAAEGSSVLVRTRDDSLAHHDSVYRKTHKEATFEVGGDNSQPVVQRAASKTTITWGGPVEEYESAKARRMLGMDAPGTSHISAADLESKLELISNTAVSSDALLAKEAEFAAQGASVVFDVSKCRDEHLGKAPQEDEEVLARETALREQAAKQHDEALRVAEAQAEAFVAAGSADEEPTASAEAGADVNHGRRAADSVVVAHGFFTFDCEEMYRKNSKGVDVVMKTTAFNAFAVPGSSPAQDKKRLHSSFNFLFPRTSGYMPSAEPNGKTPVAPGESDVAGFGWFGASRGSNPSHDGLDLLADPGAEVPAPCTGKVWKGTTSVQIDCTDGRADNLRVMLNYVDLAPGVKEGAVVSAGTLIGTVQNMCAQAKYSCECKGYVGDSKGKCQSKKSSLRPMPNHIHLEVWRGSIKVGPAQYMPQQQDNKIEVKTTLQVGSTTHTLLHTTVTVSRTGARRVETKEKSVDKEFSVHKCVPVGFLQACGGIRLAAGAGVKVSSSGGLSPRVAVIPYAYVSVEASISVSAWLVRGGFYVDLSAKASMPLELSLRGLTSLKPQVCISWYATADACGEIGLAWWHKKCRFKRWRLKCSWSSRKTLWSESSCGNLFRLDLIKPASGC